MTTIIAATFESEQVQFEIDYNTSNYLTALRCINKGKSAFTGKILHVATQRTAAQSFPAGVTTTLTIPTTTAARITATFDSKRPWHMTSTELLFVG